MSQQVASLYAEIGAKIDGFQKGSAAVKGDLRDLAGAFGVQIPAMINPMALLGGAIVGVGAALHAMEKAADAANRGDARLAAVLRATGEAAGYNFEQLNSMADSLSRVTGVDDDLIKKSQAVTATFTNISGNVFPAATKAALDMAAVLGGDLQGATIQVDKALNDFSGYTALKRAGVSFSEEQIRQIKNFKETNNLAGYQKLVLAELTKEFGGAAEAIHKAGDRSEDVAIAWGNLTEEAGGGLVPVMRGLNIYLTESINGWNNFFKGLQRGDTVISQAINTLGGLAVNLIAPLKILMQVSEWGNQMDRDNTLASSFYDAAQAVDEAADSNLDYVPTAEEVEAINKEISKTNLAMVSTIQSMQDADERFASSSVRLAQDRKEAEQELRDAMARGHEETVGEYNGLQSKIDEIKAKEAELAAERDRQTLQFISNILLQKLELDGFTTAEFEAFAKQQEAWGLWSADTVEKAKAAWEEADKVAASINAIPAEKVTTITTVHVDTYGDGKIGPPTPPDWPGNPDDDNVNLGGPDAPSDDRPPPPDGSSNWAWDNGRWIWTGSFWDNPANKFNGGLGFDDWNRRQTGGLRGVTGVPHAAGGEFMIPTSYGNEGFRMGSGDTASGGELIKITPKNQAATQPAFDYERMARAFALAVRDALMATGR